MPGGRPTVLPTVLQQLSDKYPGGDAAQREALYQIRRITALPDMTSDERVRQIHNVLGALALVKSKEADK